MLLQLLNSGEAISIDMKLAGMDGIVHACAEIESEACSVTGLWGLTEVFIHGPHPGNMGDWTSSGNDVCYSFSGDGPCGNPAHTSSRRHLCLPSPVNGRA